MVFNESITPLKQKLLANALREFCFGEEDYKQATIILTQSALKHEVDMDSFRKIVELCPQIIKKSRYKMILNCLKMGNMDWDTFFNYLNLETNK